LIVALCDTDIEIPEFDNWHIKMFVHYPKIKQNSFATSS